MNRMAKRTVWVALALSLAWALPAIAQESTGPKEQAAIAAAEKFLALVDAGKYAESWAETSSLFKSQVSQQEWVAKISGLRPFFGAVTQRAVKSSQYLTSPPGAPDGEYVLILFQTTFVKKQHAIETVTPALDQDGKWRVSGYFIK
jgi:Protein of unknown function (DUF4019)